MSSYKAPGKPESSYFRYKSRSCLRTLVKDPILVYEVLDIGIRYINAGRRSPLIERKFRLESESTKHDSLVSRVVNN